jgi:hypothetical protein
VDKKLNRRLPTGQRSGRKRLGPPRSDAPSRRAAKRRLPAVYGYREFVDGLISYGPDRVDHYRRSAIYADRLLKGAKPQDLAVEQPTKFELVFNSEPPGRWAWRYHRPYLPRPTR